jgi:hypothetical protein
MTYPPGIHRIDAGTYHADGLRPEVTLSSSLARVILNQSPRHARNDHPRLSDEYEPQESDTFDIGRAAHRMVLGVGNDIAVFPAEILDKDGGTRNKRAQEWEEAQRLAGLTPIKEKTFKRVQRIAAATKSRLDEMGIRLDPARSELTALADVGGVWCRAMVDNALDHPSFGPCLIDLKTTVDAKPEGLDRIIINYGYHIQAQFYLDAWKAATGEDRDFLFVLVEKAAPFEVTVCRMNADALFMARKQTARARDLWQQCLQSGEWPGYPLGLIEVGLPDYYTARWLERESVEADYKRRTGKDIISAAARWQSPAPMAGE